MSVSHHKLQFPAVLQQKSACLQLSRLTPLLLIFEVVRPTVNEVKMLVSAFLAFPVRLKNRVEPGCLMS